MCLLTVQFPYLCFTRLLFQRRLGASVKLGGYVRSRAIILLSHLAGLSLRVERSLEQTKKGKLRFKTPKSKYGRRTIALPVFLVADLRAHRKAQQE